jgi:hypothetical protein
MMFKKRADNVSKSFQKWSWQLFHIWNTNEAHYAFRSIQTNIYTFSRPVHSTTLPPLLNRRKQPFFAFLRRSKLLKKGNVSKMFPKNGFSFLPFNRFISNHKIIISTMNRSFFSTTHNYACKSLLRLNFTFGYEPVKLDVFILFWAMFPKNLTLITN